MQKKKEKKDSTFDFRGIFLGIVAFFCVAIFVAATVTNRVTLPCQLGFPLIIGRCLELRPAFVFDLE